MDERGINFYPFAGIGLKKIGDEYVVGIACEIARGLDASVMLQAAKVEELDGGYHVGDIFVGSEDEIPVRKRWVYALGLGTSVDLAIAAKVITGLK